MGHLYIVMVLIFIGLLGPQAGAVHSLKQDMAYLRSGMQQHGASSLGDCDKLKVTSEEFRLPIERIPKPVHHWGNNDGSIAQRWQMSGSPAVTSKNLYTKAEVLAMSPKERDKMLSPTEKIDAANGDWSWTFTKMIAKSMGQWKPKKYPKHYGLCNGAQMSSGTAEEVRGVNEPVEVPALKSGGIDLIFQPTDIAALEAYANYWDVPKYWSIGTRPIVGTRFQDGTNNVVNEDTPAEDVRPHPVAVMCAMRVSLKRLNTPFIFNFWANMGQIANTSAYGYDWKVTKSRKPTDADLKKYPANTARVVIIHANLYRNREVSAKESNKSGPWSNYTKKIGKGDARDMIMEIALDSSDRMIDGDWLQKDGRGQTKALGFLWGGGKIVDKQVPANIRRLRKALKPHVNFNSAACTAALREAAGE